MGYIPQLNLHTVNYYNWNNPDKVNYSNWNFIL